MKGKKKRQRESEREVETVMLGEKSFGSTYSIDFSYSSVSLDFRITIRFEGDLLCIPEMVSLCGIVQLDVREIQRNTYLE